MTAHLDLAALRALAEKVTEGISLRAGTGAAHATCPACNGTGTVRAPSETREPEGTPCE
jgi:hypothetical protein